jgi:hypothetical protein
MSSHRRLSARTATASGERSRFTTSSPSPAGSHQPPSHQRFEFAKKLDDGKDAYSWFENAPDGVPTEATVVGDATGAGPRSHLESRRNHRFLARRDSFVLGFERGFMRKLRR